MFMHGMVSSCIALKLINMLFTSGDFDFFSIIAQNGADFQPCFDEAIDAGFDGLYPGQEPAHYATTIESRAMFGDGEPLHAGTDSAITSLVTDMNRKKSYL